MEINSDSSVGNPGIKGVSAVPGLKSGDQENKARETAPEPENPDFKVDISKESIDAASQFKETDQTKGDSNVVPLNGENEATQLSSQTGKSLAGLDYSIATQSARKSLDVFG